MKKKLLITVTAVALVLCFVVGGTLAWLIDTTDPVVNTFTYGDIDIKLKETTGNEYKMLPGADITKDPKVIVKANSEKCWLFVEVTKSANFDSFMTFAMADGWTQNTGTNVYYKATAIETSTADQEFYVLKGNTVSVKDTVTKTDLNKLVKEGENKNLPTLTFKAYAVQYEAGKDKDGSYSATEAWKNKDATPETTAASETPTVTP